MVRKKELTEEDSAAGSVSLNQALLFTTIYIIGFPVEAHIKDGSVYSGIFHTASVHNGYGIALKKARMIKKGTHNAIVPNGGLVNTSVVFPEDLVQVVAKGVMLPADTVSIAATCDDGEAVSGTSDSCQGSENGALGGRQWIQERYFRQSTLAGSGDSFINGQCNATICNAESHAAITTYVPFNMPCSRLRL